jgi:hypothetical protein
METEVISCVLSIYTDAARLEYLTPQCFFKQNRLFIIVKREMIDMVPKAISLTLVSIPVEGGVGHGPH